MSKTNENEIITPTKMLKPLTNQQEYRMKAADAELPINYDMLDEEVQQYKYKTPSNLINAFIVYFNYCVEFEQIPSIPGFCVFDVTTKRTLKAYAKNETFAPALEYIKSILEDTFINKMFTEKTPTAALQALSNMFEWNTSATKGADRPNQTLHVHNYEKMDKAQLLEALANTRKEIEQIKESPGTNNNIIDLDSILDPE